MRRWRMALLLVVGLPVYTVVLMVVGTLVLVAIVHLGGWIGEDWASYRSDVLGILALVRMGSDFGETMSRALLGSAAVVVVGSQVVFLIPVVRASMSRKELGRRPTISMILVAGVAALMTVGLALGLLQFLEMRGVIGRFPYYNEWFGNQGSLAGPWALPTALVTLGLSWVIWSVMLIRLSRRRPWETFLGRVVGLLLVGTVLEVLVILPIHMMVLPRVVEGLSTGTFFALCVATVAALWLSGPGIVIALMGKRRRLWRGLQCEMCGYAKGPSPAAKCPECGYAWLEASRTGK